MLRAATLNSWFCYGYHHRFERTQQDSHGSGPEQSLSPPRARCREVEVGLFELIVIVS